MINSTKDKACHSIKSYAFGDEGSHNNDDEFGIEVTTLIVNQ